MSPSRRQLLQLSALAVASTAFPELGHAQSSATSAKPIALVGGDLHGPGGKLIKNSVVRVADGKIASIGTDRAAAKGADVISARGKIVTAGLVDLLTRIGVTEVSLESSTRDDELKRSSPIRAAFLAADGYNPASSLVAIARSEGLSSVGVTPTGGLVMGQSAWADLAGTAPASALAKRSLALHVRIDDASLGRFNASRGTAMLHLRQLLDDARAYKANKRSFDRRQMRRLATSRLDLEVVVRAIDGKLPVVFHVDRASDILGVLSFAAVQKLRMVLASAAEAWKVAKQIASAKIGVIVYPLDHGPRTFAALGAREDNAALLKAAGCTVALSTGDSHNARKLRQVAGNAVRAGLAPAAALEAITEVPARLFDMADYGAPQVGRLANLVVWSADPFELSTKVEHMLIRGQRVSLRNRQTALFERYR